MNLTFAANLTKMIDAGLGREAAPPETFVAVGRTTEYTDLGPVAIASFETNVEAPLRALSVTLEPIQAGTGDPSPENVRPITGRQSVKVTRAGKNLFTRTGEVHAYLDSAGNVREYGTGWLLSDYIRVAPSTQYTFNPNSTAGGAAKSWYFDANKNGISYIESGGSTFTTPDNCSFMRFSYREASSNVQLELGSIATPYEPYNGQTVTLQLGETVYGGTLDVVSGALTVDKVKIVFDGTQGNPSANWRANDESVGWLYSLAKTPGLANNNTLWGELRCDTLKPVTYGDIYVNTIDSVSIVGGVTYGIAMRMRNTALNTADAINAYLAEHPVEVVYPLATPQTVQLTPEQITTLIGQNNVWSDGGDVSLTYGTTKYTEGY